MNKTYPSEGTISARALNAFSSCYNRHCQPYQHSIAAAPTAIATSNLAIHRRNPRPFTTGA